MQKQQTNSKTIYRHGSLAGIVIVLALLFMPVMVYAPVFRIADIRLAVSGAPTQCAQNEKANADGSCSLPPITNSTACSKGQCIIDRYIQPGINLMAALVGLVVTISFITAGIRYASSADSPQKVSEAKQRMVTSVFVLIGFFTFYAAMNYLIPGGLI